MVATVAYISGARVSGDSARLRLVECRAILGGERDRLRAVWDDQATAKDRRLLLAMAGKVGPASGRLAGRAWCDLAAADRVAIAGGLRRWAGWAEKLA